MLLGENIKRLRAEKGISQRELARRIDMSGQMISKIEKAETSPSIETLSKIANTLDVSINDLIGDATEAIPAGIRLELTQKRIDSLQSTNINSLKNSVIESLHTLLCIQTTGEYLAIELSQKDLEKLISRLLLVFEIELKQNGSVAKALLKLNKE